jgi:hypothetical protein
MENSPITAKHKIATPWACQVKTSLPHVTLVYG